MPNEGERLAVLESVYKRQREDTKEILEEIKNISAFIYEFKPQVEKLEEALLDKRLNILETRFKQVSVIALFLLSITAMKDSIYKLLFS